MHRKLRISALLPPPPRPARVASHSAVGDNCSAEAADGAMWHATDIYVCQQATAPQISRQSGNTYQTFGYQTFATRTRTRHLQHVPDIWDIHAGLWCPQPCSWSQRRALHLHVTRYSLTLLLQTGESPQVYQRDSYLLEKFHTLQKLRVAGCEASAESHSLDPPRA